MIKCLVALLMIPLLGVSQPDVNTQSKGIIFEQFGSWNEVLAKAKVEKKYIFMDCYTTWCAPCKRMDKEVFPLESVGIIYNKNFISIRVQMDRTPRDESNVKIWYADADSIRVKYQVEAFPTYLFFSPDGNPVHRAVGGLPEEKFKLLGIAALDTTKQSYRLEAKYARERINLQSMSDESLKSLAQSYKNTIGTGQ